MNGEERFFGIAQYHGQLYLLEGQLADFILDYLAYDPEFFEEKNSADYRSGVVTVTTDNILQFLEVLNGRALSPSEANALSKADSDKPDLVAYIDFDSREYVHSYYDLALEEYVPKGWRGALGDPRQKLRDLHRI